MRMNLIVIAGVMAITAQAFAQDEAAPPPAEGTPPPPPEGADSSVGQVNEPVKEAAGKAGEELNVRPAEGNYGNAGCGLGSLLFSPSNDFTQVFAATTNGTSGNQTFGISSGTSNCDGSGYQPGSAQAFVQTNRAALAKDIARGKGATITGLSELAGCQDARAVGHVLRRNFKSIFPGPQAGDKEVSESVIQVLKHDHKLACTNLV